MSELGEVLGSASRPRLSVPTALVVAASLLGDTFLYTVLPVSAARLGIAPLLVGVILSLNRWVRLLTNPLAARLYARHPAGRLVFLAIVLAAISTALYAEPAWIIVLLAARLLWGFAFSLLRLGSIVSAIDEAGARAGRKLGETRALWAFGYLAGALYAPFAVEAVGWGYAVIGAAVLTFVAGVGPALAVASWRRHASTVVDGPPGARIREPRLLLLLFVGAAQLALSAGIQTVAGGLRIAELYPDGAPIFAWVVPATFVAGGFVLTQRVAQVVWQPVAGRFADRALDRTFVLSTLAVISGVAVLTLRVDALTFLAAGALAYFAGLNGAIVAELAVARLASAIDRPRILAAFHSAQDFGAAAGALAGGALASIGTDIALATGAAAIALTLPAWFVARRAHARVMATA